MIDKKDKVLLQVAKSLQVPPEWLYNLIRFESGWNPKATAKIPYNKKRVDAGLEAPRYARGLIQFIDSTAESLGYVSADDLVNKNPDVYSQLMFPVLQYLSKFKPFSTEQSFYLSVFYPAARSWPINKVFPDSVIAANPKILTPGDYVKKVRGGGGATILFSAVATALIYFMLKGRKTSR